jgi:hypothetical protein
MSDSNSIRAAQFRARMETARRDVEAKISDPRVARLALTSVRRNLALSGLGTKAGEAQRNFSEFSQQVVKEYGQLTPWPKEVIPERDRLYKEVNRAGDAVHDARIELDKVDLALSDAVRWSRRADDNKQAVDEILERI